LILLFRKNVGINQSPSNKRDVRFKPPQGLWSAVELNRDNRKADG